MKCKDKGRLKINKADALHTAAATSEETLSPKNLEYRPRFESINQREERPAASSRAVGNVPRREIFTHYQPAPHHKISSKAAKAERPPSSPFRRLPSGWKTSGSTYPAEDPLNTGPEESAVNFNNPGSDSTRSRHSYVSNSWIPVNEYLTATVPSFARVGSLADSNHDGSSGSSSTGGEKKHNCVARVKHLWMSRRSALFEHGDYHKVIGNYLLLAYSGHGHQHWFLPMGLLRRFFWIVSVNFFWYIMFHQSILATISFLEFPKSVSISVVDEDVAEFPAVTVCNFNMLSRSRLNYHLKSGHSKLPKRYEHALNLQRRFENVLNEEKPDAKPNFQAICTKTYKTWQSPSLKVAPVEQPFPYETEEELWGKLRVHKQSREMDFDWESFPDPAGSSSTPRPVMHPGKAPDGAGDQYWGAAEDPCQQMLLYGLQDGFKVKTWKVKLWESETGSNFTDQFRLPDPGSVFQCSEDGLTLIGMNDSALSEICGKASYDAATNRPCIKSYLQSDGVPFYLSCFPLNRICDGHYDCGEHDSTDETLYCDTNSGNPKCDEVDNLSDCKNGLCYETSLRCDGFEDCTDGTDERDCQGLKFDKNCGCYVFCENGTKVEQELETSCYRVSPFDGVLDGNVEKIMWRSKTTGDFNEVSSLLAPNPEEIREFGVRGKDFIVSCSFDGVPCSYKDFFKWQNQEYGNCFTFNSPRLGPASATPDKPFKTAKYGYGNGLRLTLNIDPDDYLSAVTPNQGARMSIHERNQYPFPAEHGLNLSPLTQTTIGVKRKHIQRVSRPHGMCNQTNQDEWTNHFNATYSPRACNKVCLESLIRRKCSCSEMFNPVLPNEDSTTRICSLANRTQTACVDALKKLFQERDPKIIGEAGPGCWLCAPSCDEWVMELFTSGAVRSKFFQYIFSSVNKVQMTDDFCSGETYGYPGSSNVHAHVFLMDSLSYQEIVESPGYSLLQLISNVGGIWGVFAQFSFVTFIEWLEMMLNVVLLFIKKMRIRAAARRGT